MIRLDTTPTTCTLRSTPHNKKQKESYLSTITSVNMKCIFLKLTAFAVLATSSASGVYASSESDEPSSTTPQSLRGSFLDENEDADWWGGGGGTGWGPQGGGDLSTCKTHCQCPLGKIPLKLKLPQFPLRPCVPPL